MVNEKELRLWFAGLIVIAANAGGAWSPIGDVTTTMLWIAKKVSVMPLMITCYCLLLFVMQYLPLLLLV